MENYISIEDEQVKCTHPLVKKAWEAGSLGNPKDGKLENRSIENRGTILEVILWLYNGTHKDFKWTKEKSHIEQANEYLNELDNKIYFSEPIEGKSTKIARISFFANGKESHVYTFNSHIVSILSESEYLSGEATNAKTEETKSLKERVITELDFIK